MGRRHRFSSWAHLLGWPRMTPWTCSFRDYRKLDGMMIPMEGEVGWILPEGELSYWRGRIVSAEYLREGE